jgi:hypothetical protein
MQLEHIICEYCSRPFNEENPCKKTNLKVRFKNEDHIISIDVCPSCIGQLAQYDGEMPDGAISLYKISKYNFPKNKKQKKEDNTLLVYNSKKPLWNQQKKK